MDLLDLTLSSDDEVPRRPSASQRACPTSTPSQPPGRLGNVNIPRSGLRVGGRRPSASSDESVSINKHCSASGGSPRAIVNDEGPRTTTNVIDLSSDEDDVQVEGQLPASTKRPTAKAQNTRTKASGPPSASRNEIVLLSDSDSDSIPPAPRRLGPRHSSPHASIRPVAKESLPEHSRTSARGSPNRGKSPPNGHAKPRAITTRRSPLSHPGPRRDALCFNIDSDNESAGRGGGASTSQATTSNLSSSARLEPDPATFESTSAEALRSGSARSGSTAVCRAPSVASNSTSRTGKDKARNQDAAAAEAGFELVDIQTPREPASAAVSTAPGSIAPSSGPVSSDAVLARRRPPSSSLPATFPDELPSPSTELNAQAETTPVQSAKQPTKAVEKSAKIANSESSESTASSPHRTTPAEPPPSFASAPLASNPNPSVRERTSSTNSAPAQMDPARPLYPRSDDPDVLVLSSSSELGDSDPDSDSDIEIISTSVPASNRVAPRHNVSSKTHLEQQEREERELQELETKIAELEAKKRKKQAKEGKEKRVRESTEREKEERDKAEQDALRERARKTEERERAERERAGERERNEAEQAEREKTRLETERRQREKTAEDKRKREEAQERESEAERARVAARDQLKQNQEEEAREEEKEKETEEEEEETEEEKEEEEEERRICRDQIREEAERNRRQQEREEAEELDHFCQVELPRLQAETQEFRNTLREVVKEKWDDVLGHIIATEGVSSADEYEERVDKATLALAAVFDPEKWTKPRCQSGKSTEHQERVEGDSAEGLQDNVVIDVVPETAATEWIAQAPCLGNHPAETPLGAEADELRAGRPRDRLVGSVAASPADRRHAGFATDEDETDEDETDEDEMDEDEMEDGWPRVIAPTSSSQKVRHRKKLPKRVPTTFAASESESESENDHPISSVAQAATKLRQESADSSSGLSATVVAPRPDASPRNSCLLPSPVAGARNSERYYGHEPSREHGQENETPSTSTETLPKKKRKNSSIHLKTARKSTGGQQIHLVTNTLRAIKSTNARRVLSHLRPDRQRARESSSVSPDPLLFATTSKKRTIEETDRNRLWKKRLRGPNSDTEKNQSAGGSGTSTPESTVGHAKTKLSVGVRGGKEPHQQIINAPLIVGDAVATISGADSERIEVTEENFKREQMSKTHSHLRQIAGPSYDRDDEFPKTIQASVQRREREWKENHPTGGPPLRDGYRELYEQMISDANSKEFPPGRKPSIRVIPLPGAKDTEYSSPMFELCYTNRVVYADGIVPDQAPGCGCIGDCGSPLNRAGCACRARQIAASTTRANGGQRSGIQNFAYDSNGFLDERIFDSDDPIIECNSQCGCGDDCINRVIGNKKAISVDIFRTADKGWGIRNPRSYSGLFAHVGRTFRKGEPLGIYAGELITLEEGELRDKLIYSKTHRCYTYTLDAWTVGEDYKALAPKADAEKMKVSSTSASHVVAPRAVPTGKKSRKTKVKRKDAKRLEAKVVGQDEDDEDSFSGIYNVDAFTYGNWTRFANHVCIDYNMVPRCVYVDEINVTRPLWTYVARRDIKPGEELTISYFSGEEPRLHGGMDLRTWKKLADELRSKHPKNFRCYCGKDLCRGVMFATGKPEFYDPPDYA